jgi:hypothetical protein
MHCKSAVIFGPHQSITRLAIVFALDNGRMSVHIAEIYHVNEDLQHIDCFWRFHIERSYNHCGIGNRSRQISL